MKIGVLPLARATFDVDFAGQALTLMREKLAQTGHKIAGAGEMLCGPAEARQALAELRRQAVDHVLLLQLTFTDASTATAAAGLEQPLSIWAAPEPRLGGRLRLNAFCGLNLASHALSRRGRKFSWLYADPAFDVADEIDAMFTGRRAVRRLHPADAAAFAAPAGRDIVHSLRGRRIARIGEPPAGFDTCAYAASGIHGLAGVTVEELELGELFDAARAVSAGETAAIRRTAENALSGMEDVDQEQLHRSLRLNAGLDSLRRRGGYDAFAVRCWPEAFTEYGGALCGPVAMMGEAKVPCACEADVYGALSQMVLQEAAGAAVFLSDLVDLDVEDDSGVLWHCGQAPLSMRDPETEACAAVHSNRSMPLLYQFPLKPGAVTFMRISQSFNRPKMILGAGKMLKRPPAFTGTCGVVRFERGAGRVLNDIMDSGVEHHLAFAYGDHRPLLRAVAAAMDLPLLEM